MNNVQKIMIFKKYCKKALFMSNSDIGKINKEMWEKTATIHRKAKMNDLLNKFKEPGYSLLDDYEADFLLNKINVKNKDVIQLCCNNARELLSIKNLGAKRCVGIDITEGFIQQGKELASVANQELELYSLDVFEIPNSFYNNFDVVYISIGAITWIKDLNLFIKIVNNLLRIDGFLLLYDFHPILNMFEPSKEDPIIPKYSYFKEDPFIEEEGFDYYDKTVKIESKAISFTHTLESIFMECINNSLSIKEFREYSHDISNVFMIYEDYGYPMSYILLAQKQT